jgi:hypothetical protein
MAVNSIALILFGLFLLLGVFMLLSWLINLALKKNIINGAKYYLIVACILFVIHLITGLNVALEYMPIGLIIALFIGAYSLPVLIAFLLMRRFNKKNQVLDENS